MWELYETECHKQHINLSNQAHDIIFMDMMNFMGEKNVSGFVNRIIENFCDEAKASYVESLLRKRAEIEEALLDIPESATKKEIVTKLIDDYRKKIDMEVAGYPGGESISIRLGNANYEKFFTSYNSIGEYYSRQGQYFKALLEEYASLPQDKREAVFFKETIEDISSIILKKTMIRYLLKNGSTYEMRPIEISVDPQTGWNYLIGYSRSYQSEQEWRLVSVRISRITRVAEIRSRSGRVTRDELRSAVKRMSSRGIAYIMGEPEDIKLRLTECGMQKLEMTLHLRPYFEKAEEPNVIITKCTQMQAADYFAKFAKEVEVIAPDSFKEKLAARYKDQDI